MKAPATILIVDDDSRSRRLLQALLGPEGYAIRTAASGEEALASIADSPPDLMLLDVMMPGSDGRQVAAAVKADPATCHIPIIIVTAQTDRAARLAALAAGAEEFLTKPVDRAELWLRVRNLLRLKELQDRGATLEAQVRARTADLQRFRTALDATGDAIFLVSRATMRFIEVNTTATQMLGYTREELLNLGPVDVSSRSRAEFEVLYDTIIAGHLRTESTDAASRKDGSTLPVEAHRHAQRAGGDWTIVVVLRDITERTEAESLLQHLAHYDALTGLPNRALFYEMLTKSLAHASDVGQTLAVFFLDLDGFKNVNDTYGHAIGNELLVQVGDRLIGCVRARDSVGRLGGDEFAILLSMRDRHDAAVVAAKIRMALQEPFHLSGNDVTVTASIGIALHPEDASDAETLIKYADTAMYKAKQAGRDAFRFFTSAMDVEVRRRLELETALRQAVKNGEFVLYYQPKVELSGGDVVGLEALLRWNRPGRGLVPPSEFIYALEESGLIADVGRWVIDAACEQVMDWIRRGIGPVQVSVNVSPRQFLTGDLDGDVLRALDTYEVPVGLLELEMTETSLMTNTDRTIEILRNLKSAGVLISIDDFGTAYSSLAYLRRFPIDKLKIDSSFIREVIRSTDDDAITRAIIEIGHSLDLEVIAEGVETVPQLEYLRRHECDQIQGYCFSPPLPVPAIERLLLARTRLPAPAHHGNPA